MSRNAQRVPGPGGVDPRTIITADAFTVAPELLGLPLARPRRRAAAMLVDLLLAAILAAIGGLKLFVFATALLLMRATLRRPAHSGPLRQAAAWAGRGFALVLLLVLASIVVSRASDFLERPRVTLGDTAQGTVSFGLRDARVLGLIAELEGSTTDSAARHHAERIAAWVRNRSADSVVRARTAAIVLDRLADLEHRAVLEQALAPLLAGGTSPAPAGGDEAPGASDAGAAPVDAPVAPTAAGPVRASADELPAEPDAAALTAYADAVERGDSAAAARLRPAAEAAIAGPRIRRLEADARDLREDLAQANTELAQRGGLRGFLSRLGDDLGVGFGWFAVYFTGFVMLWNGQTPGKRLFGVRVLRLDGKRISWWVSFERFGGYAASLSTGLLGFLQILWDRNRQGLHDKAVGTVVVRVGPPTAPAAAGSAVPAPEPGGRAGPGGPANPRGPAGPVGPADSVRPAGPADPGD